MDILWIILVLVAFMLAFYILFLGKKKKTATDYYNLFITGFMWFVIGLIMKNYVLAAAGLLLTILGLNYRNKWRKEIKPWKELDTSEKTKRITELILVSALILAGIIFIIQ